MCLEYQEYINGTVIGDAHTIQIIEWTKKFLKVHVLLQNLGKADGSNLCFRDLPSGPVVKNLPSSSGDMGWILFGN